MPRAARLGLGWALAFGATLAAGAAVAADRQSTVQIDLPDGFKGPVVVEIDGARADAFSTVEGKKLTLKIPFPNTDTPSVVKVVDSATGAVLLTGPLTHEADGWLFSKIDFEKSGQVDGFAADRATPMPIVPGFTPKKSLGSGRAKFDAKSNAGRWTAGVHSEFVGTTEKTETLRPSGSLFDVANAYAFTTFQEGTTQIDVKVGDVALAARNDLINTGFASRGISVSATMLDGRLVAEVGHLYGVDIVGAVHGPIGWQSSSQRIGAGAEYKLLTEGPVLVTVGAAVLDTIRPSSTSFGIGNVPQAESNLAYGFKLFAATPDGKVAYNGMWGRARYDNPPSLDPSLPPGTPKPPATHDVAWKHTLDYQAWNGQLFGEAASLRFSGEYDRSGPFYMSVQSAAIADLDLKQGIGALAIGPFQSTATFKRTHNNVSHFPGLLEAGVTTWQSQNGLSLDALWPRDTRSTFWQVVTPTDVSLLVTREDLATLNGPDVITHTSLTINDLPARSTTALTAGANWTFGPTITAFAYSYTFVNSKQIGALRQDRHDNQIDATETFNGGFWDATVHLTWVGSNDLDPLTRARSNRLDWGAAFNLKPEAWPTFSAGYESSDNNRHDLVLFATDTGHNARWNASVNFAPFIQAHTNLGFVPSVVLSWQRGRSTDMTGGVFNRVTSEVVVLNVGTAF